MDTQNTTPDPVVPTPDIAPEVDTPAIDVTPQVVDNTPKPSSKEDVGSVCYECLGKGMMDNDTKYCPRCNGGGKIPVICPMCGK